MQTHASPLRPARVGGRAHVVVDRLDHAAGIVLAGTFIGVAIALAVLGGLGRWLPAGARARWWATVALAAAIPAIVLLDPADEDFRLFGPVWLAIGLFTLLPITSGAGVATLATRIPTISHAPAVPAAPGRPGGAGHRAAR